jgi:hypothetical protein
MPVLKRRNRMVNFRLSEDEYESLKNFCVAEGARSISDFARATLCQAMNHNAKSGDPSLDTWVHRIDGKVDDLDRAVRSLTELVVEQRQRKRAKAAQAN